MGTDSAYEAGYRVEITDAGNIHISTPFDEHYKLILVMYKCRGERV